MNSQPIVIDESLQRAIDTSTAMHRNAQMVLAENMANLPEATIKAYTPKQKEWREWCSGQAFDDGEIVTDLKLCFFIKDFVMKRGRKLKKNGDGSSIPLGRESILGYVKAVVNLYNRQKALNSNMHEHPRGPLVKKLLDGLERDKAKAKRRNFEDRGKNTLNDGYTKEELHKISQYFLTQKNGPTGCRDRLCFLLSHAMLCRSQTALGMQFADLFSLTLENQGVSECIALVATITFGKTNQHGKIEYGSSVRHKEVELCSIGALAFHPFARFHHENEPFPDFTTRSNWYEIALFNGEDLNTPITYRSQNRSYTEAFKFVGIHTSKVTHATRKSALNMIAQENVSGDQQRMVGRWGTDRMVGCYVSSLPVEAMKSLAGFSNHQGNYYVSRSSVVPCDELQKMIFPQVDFWSERFAANDGSVQEDIAGPNFLKLLSYLRIVFLQDSVVLKKKYPGYFLWEAAVFSHDLYKEFEQQLLLVIQQEEGVFSVAHMVQLAMPQLASDMQSGFLLISSLIKDMQEQIRGLQAANNVAGSQMEARFANFLSYGLQIFGGSLDGRPPAIVPQNSASSDVVVPQHDVTNDEPTAFVPVYSLSRSLRTVTDLWREYTVGLDDRKVAVRDLEEKYSTAWRPADHESRYFNRRNEVYQYIISRANIDRVSEDEAARRLEDRRIALDLSLDQLRKKLKIGPV